MQVQLHEGDNRESLRKLIAQGVQVDSVVTDAPYGLLSIQKRMGAEDSAPVKFGTDGAFSRLSKGFFGKKWDGTGIERDPEFWELIMGVLKPGGFVFACGGPRTIHRQIVAMEDAGFVIYPLHGWEYGTGLPKGKPSPRGESWKFGAGAPKIGFEPIALAMKPLAEKGFKENIIAHGVGDLNIGECRDEIGRYPSTVIRVPEIAGDLIYHPKAGKLDRAGSKHPTVKPIALMQYLIRHITPPGHYECPKCQDIVYDHRQKDANTDTPVRAVRQGVQAEGQQESRTILRQDLRQQSHDVTRKNLQAMQSDFSTQGESSEFLLEDLCLPMVAKNEAHDKRVQVGCEGVCVDLHTRASECAEVGVCATAPTAGRDDAWETVGNGGGCPSHQRNQERQPRREFTGHVKSGSRQAEFAEAERYSVSLLPSKTDNEPTCPACGCHAIWKNSVILDPFAGSGTTAVAAQREGFDCILMEAEVEYINFLNARFNLNEYDLSDLLG